MTLIVRLRSNPEALAIESNRMRRPSREAIQAVTEASARRVEECIRELRRTLDFSIGIEPLVNLNALLVECPAADAIRLRKQILDTCKDAVEVIEDFEVESIR